MGSWSPAQIGAALLQKDPRWHSEASKWPSWPRWGSTTPGVLCFVLHMKHEVPISSMDNIALVQHSPNGICELGLMRVAAQNCCGFVLLSFREEG